MWIRHAVPLALAALGFLAACGGGDTATEGGTVPETPELPETALFSAETASRLQMLTNAGPFEGLTDEERESRDAQDRMGRPPISWLDDPTDERHDTIKDLALGHWEDVRWSGVLTKNGVKLFGSRSGGDRALSGGMDHAHFSVFTTEALGGGIAAGAWGVPTGSAPAAGATWRGLMIGAAKNDGRDLLQGDAEISFDFDDMTVDASFTNIVNLDRMAAHSGPPVDFMGVLVSADGTWARGDNDTPEFIRGGFAGRRHEEAAGYFWTPDMMGSFGAAEQ